MSVDGIRFYSFQELEPTLQEVGLGESLPGLLCANFSILEETGNRGVSASAVSASMVLFEVEWGLFDEYHQNGLNWKPERLFHGYGGKVPLRSDGCFFGERR